ncbi:MAG TPA: hypothetical protein PLX35_01275 [Cyclobacteriaceae bacterium]|nr:hypothetical protein [Cyclobacteriaceae bacterium]
MKRFLIFCCLPLVSWAQVPAEKALSGVWQNNSFGYQMVLILQPDGTGEFDGEILAYASAPGRLSITIGSTTTVYAYSLQGNNLTLSGGDLQGVVAFTREGVSAISDPQSSTVRNGITDTRLLGLWSGNGETIDFRADGQCIYLGNTLTYKLSQGYVTLISRQGNAAFGYTIQGNTLTLSANGQNIKYNKVTGAVSSPPASQTGDVPAELVGKWCYLNMTSNSQTSRCLTLNADGTYTYVAEGSRSVNTETLYGATASQDGDQGTWWVKGDRIYYNSRSRGEGSYRLEKRNHPKNTSDPMIVLDGEPYVTATLRAPWRY